MGYALAHPDIEQISYAGTKTILDLDVLLWAPGELFSEFKAFSDATYQGLPRLGDDNSHDLDRAVSRRRHEMNEFLEMGRTLVLFVPTPREVYVTTGHSYQGTGRSSRQVNHVALFKLLAAIPFELRTVAAKTKAFEMLAGTPFAKFWKAHGSAFSAAAYIDGPWGSPMVRIRNTDKVVAAVATVHKSVVLALPELDDGDANEGDHDQDDGAEGATASKAVAQAQRKNPFFIDLFDLIEALRGGSVSDLPTWTKQVRLPGEGEQLEKVNSGRRKLSTAAEKLAADEHALAVLRNRKAMFTSQGPVLEILVEQALTALGGNVVPGSPGRTDRIIKFKQGVAVLEIKGKAKSGAEEDSAQLEKWVAEYLIANGEQAKPILVINAWRDLQLDQRNKEPFPDQMLPYATARNHCLVTTLQLLGAWLSAEQDPKSVDEITNALFETRGLFPLFRDWREFINVASIPTSEERVLESGI
jgi:hypothetical protein